VLIVNLLKNYDLLKLYNLKLIKWRAIFFLILIVWWKYQATYKYINLDNLLEGCEECFCIDL